MTVDVVLGTVAVMSTRTYSLAAGIALLGAAVILFALPALLDYDAFIPVILAIGSLLGGIAVLVSGLQATD